MNPECLGWIDGGVYVLLYFHTSISQYLHPVCFVQNLQSYFAATSSEKVRLQVSTLQTFYVTARQAGCGDSSPCQMGKTLQLIPQTTGAFLLSWNVVLLSGVSPGFSCFCYLPAWDLLDSLLLPGQFPLNLAGHYCCDRHKKSSFQIKAGCAILTEEKVRKAFRYPR